MLLTAYLEMFHWSLLLNASCLVVMFQCVWENSSQNRILSTIDFAASPVIRCREKMISVVQQFVAFVLATAKEYIKTLIYSDN